MIRHSRPLLCPSPSEALADYRRIRHFSRFICDFLEPEDCVVQSMPDVSPTRWHLAHTTWFFETFVLRSLDPEYRSPSDQFQRLFNSYYNTVGDPFPRHQRGLLSRPTVAEVWRYRQHVDEILEDLLDRSMPEEHWERVGAVIQLGLQHEQQHQELMLTDIKHVFSCNPLYPALDPRGDERRIDAWPTQDAEAAGRSETPSHAEWLASEGGIVEIGHSGEGFAYDNETPRHRVLLEPFELATSLVTNGQFAEFIEDGGYQNPDHWLDAGWHEVQQHGWRAPLYWVRRDGQWWEFTLSGLRPLRDDEPVCHVSFYEADAYARWRGCRLPSEAEWESVAASYIDHPACYGTFADHAMWHPQPPSTSPYPPDTSPESASAVVPRQLFGDVWQWTASPYLGYPGYRPAAGALGEYNGKFMCNQFVLRGGSAATSRDHIRHTYRNFFAPDARWQFSGIRLAR